MLALPFRFSVFQVILKEYKSLETWTFIAYKSHHKNCDFKVQQEKERKANILPLWVSKYVKYTILKTFLFLLFATIFLSLSLSPASFYMPLFQVGSSSSL